MTNIDDMPDESKIEKEKEKKKETAYQAMKKNRTRKQTEFKENVANVIASLKNKIKNMETKALCNSCADFVKTDLEEGKGPKIQTLTDIRGYIRDHPCLCKNHITEFATILLKEKSKRGGKTRKSIRKTKISRNKRKTRKIV
jgi:hypothetical protein